MLPKFLVSLLFLALNISTFGQSTLVGNWKRVKQVIKYNGAIIRQAADWGDLEIREDSTFHIVGIRQIRIQRHLAGM